MTEPATERWGTRPAPTQVEFDHLMDDISEKFDELHKLLDEVRYRATSLLSEDRE